MENLSMCRVCLGGNIRLNSIVDTHLQEIYETLVMVPFETKDFRPLVVCYICRARLQNCYELRKSCLRSEELLTQMLSSNELKPLEIQDSVSRRLSVGHNVVHISVGDAPQMNDHDDQIDAMMFVNVKLERRDSEDSDRGNLESESDQSASQPSLNEAESHDNTPSNHQTEQSSQWSQNIIIETGHHQDQLNTRHTINVIVNNNKKERQKRYREQNREKLKQREAERRKRMQYLQSIGGATTSSNTELNNGQIITAQSSSIQRNDQANKLIALQRKKERQQIALQRKRERQQRYREQNRDKLKQREAERRRRLQNADVITELSTSPNIEFTQIINDPTTEDISTNSRVWFRRNAACSS